MIPRRLIVPLLVAIAIPACASHRGLREEGAKWRLEEGWWKARASRVDREELYREFAIEVQRLAGEGEESASLAPLFRDFAELLASSVGREAPSEFLRDFQHSLDLLEKEKIPAALAQARRSGRVGRDVLVEYRIPYMQRSLVTMRSASWGMEAYVRGIGDGARGLRADAGRKRAPSIDPADLHAIVIGVDAYDDAEISRLRWCVSDAAAIRAHLTENLEVPEGNVLLLRNPDQAGLREALRSTFDRVGERKESTLVFYFSGHGVPDEGPIGERQLYLLPRDARTSDLSSSALSNQELAGWLTRFRSRAVVVVVDACHSGALSFEDDLRRRWLSFRPHMFFASSSPTQKSKERETLRHGLFTHQFLVGAGGDADADADGLVTGLEVFLFLRKNRASLEGQEPALRTLAGMDPIVLGRAPAAD